ncbi:hypothetical protein [Streptomyces californicus]|uniref:hypothetical protein n=1 Tax=Streptomyces californicus TaxID=67351 RepID=UPI0037A7A30B
MSGPHVGWPMAQRSAAKRYVQFAAVFAVLGVAFSIFLIISGDSGGWALLGILARISVVGYFFIQRGERAGLTSVDMEGVTHRKIREAPPRPFVEALSVTLDLVAFHSSGHEMNPYLYAEGDPVNCIPRTLQFRWHR